jgi:hypothetical protein
MVVKESIGKHAVLVDSPTGRRISMTYSTLKEAEGQAASLERSGYTVIEIVQTTLPKPNAG